MTGRMQGMMSYSPEERFLSILYLSKFPKEMDSKIKGLGFTEYRTKKGKGGILSYKYSGTKQKAKTLVPKIEVIAKENNLEFISENAKKAYANFFEKGDGKLSDLVGSKR